MFLKISSFYLCYSLYHLEVNIILSSNGLIKYRFLRGTSIVPIFGYFYFLLCYWYSSYYYYFSSFVLLIKIKRLFEISVNKN